MEAVKLTVELSREVVDALHEMARGEDTSVTEQLRRAVEVKKWMYDQQRNVKAN